MFTYKKFKNAIVRPAEKIIKIGKCTFRPFLDIYLEDVSISINSNNVIIEGIKRKFDYHDEFDSLLYDGRENFEKKYFSNESDWYKYTPPKIFKFFGAKEKIKLRQKAYMLREDFGKETYIFRGNCVIIHNE
jgi:hypothetical protein